MNEREHRRSIAESVMATGNPWIDDAFAGGLDRENMILIAAKTGIGKTFFGVQVAGNIARSGKRVAYFALEAEKHEIERRKLYYEISRVVHERFSSVKMPRYKEWLHLKDTPEWESIEQVANANVSEIERTNLKTVYAHGVYTPDMFQMDVESLLCSDEPPPDVIFLDHLHHFFLSGDEIDALKVTIHQIKRLKDDLGVPIVILAQLRKNDFGSGGKRTLPKLEDIRGTASLTDVATDVIIISEVSEDKLCEMPGTMVFPMYFHIAKSRTASEARQFAGIVGFNPKKGSYNDYYFLSKIRAHEDPMILESNGPDWATKATYPRASVNYAKLPTYREDD